MIRTRSAAAPRGFTLVELLVVIAIIGVLVSLLLPAVQAAREAARRMSCSNNLKQLGLAVHNFHSSYNKLPNSGQCGSTGSTTTPYMIHSTATQLLPYMEQQNVYDMFDHNTTPDQFGCGLSGNVYVCSGGALIHRNSKGRHYTDDAWPTGKIAAKTLIPSFICPSSPVGGKDRDPQFGYAGFDYMFPDLTDIMEIPGHALFGQRTVPTGGAEWLTQVRRGMLDCENATFAGTTDGTANTILCIEDASRSHPLVTQFGALSNRPSPVPSSEEAPWTGGATGGRRVFAWADPDCVGNGYSGPNGASDPSKRLAKFNNNKSPIGGPVWCPWTVNNCGPNDEPFAFHPGGVNCAMGDGSVRFFSDNVEPLITKMLVGRNDGGVFNMP